MDLHISTLLKYYKRADVQEALIEYGHNKEVAVRYGKDGGYGKRPDTLQYPKDVISLVQNGATSFHCSEELWSNPMHLTTQMKRSEQDDLRSGWDLILDIDCPILAYSQIAANILYNALTYHGLTCVTIKFSGNHGFHLAVPFEAFPSQVNGMQTRTLFPEGPRRIAAYLKEMIRRPLAEQLLAFQPLSGICGSLGKNPVDLLSNNEFDPFKALVIDTVLISSRHLYRMPYSFNEKSGLVSIPIAPSDTIIFDKETARPECVLVGAHPFLVREGFEPGEARRLLLNAFDFKLPDDKIAPVGIRREFDTPQEAIPIECFPPCIMSILRGMEDGKKRGLFILTNFLSSCGWSAEQIETLCESWNKTNKDPLREVILKGHLLHHSKNRAKVLPPNCDNQAYYLDLGICTPDGLCKRIKNPANYAFIRAKMRREANMRERDNSEGIVETN
ncbi:hypothetical protein HY641_03720 [Candidatus Woesearchaeota archaeon]|nr:hypothetical protein [Candidatus Woesearchaeota archaeon]